MAPPRNNTPIDPQLDPTSPYFVHPSDGPATVKVVPPLTGGNYHSWARSMRRALGAKMKLEFIDGSIPIPEDSFDPSTRAWNRCNMLIISWIINSVSESIAQSIVYMENALDVWNDLKERFSQGDLVRISELYQEIYSLKQENKSVTEFYSELKILWEELEIYMPLPQCTCRVRCSCAAMRDARNHHNLLYIIRFLTGLNENFAVVKSQILLMDPLPSMNKIFSMVLQHERQGNFAISEDSQALINAVGYKKFSAKGGTSNTASNTSKSKICTHCGRTGHTVEVCYRKHGFPPHFGKGSTANNASTTEEPDDNGDRASASRNQDGQLPITQEQYATLVNLLQQSNIQQGSSTATSNQVYSSTVTGNTSVNIPSNQQISVYKCAAVHSWIIDSGASDHICSNRAWFHSVNSIKPIHVKLPNGQFALAKFIGVVKFSDFFHIPDVLYIPEFSVNLISVPKLCQTNQYNVIFRASDCFIQEISSLKMIGSAEKIDGLYHLILSSKLAISSSLNNVSVTIPSSALWHFRLGHLSSTRLEKLHASFPFIDVDKNSICDVCHYAKHKKLPFNNSFNHASHLFDLVHFDVWGPLSTKSHNGHSYFLTAVDDFSRFTWVILMKSKAETRQHVINFVKMIETQYHLNVKCIRSDNGPEFAMSTFYNSKGIIHQTSCVETPQQNGRVERKHQDILNIARALLFQANLPKKFWSFAVNHAVFIMNRVPTRILKHKSPYQCMFDRDPDLENLKTFGTLAYASTLQAHRTKLDHRARKCVFLGYKQNVKGVMLLDINTRETFISRHVTHHDHIFPLKPNWQYHTHENVSLEPSTDISSFENTISSHDDCITNIPDVTPSQSDEPSSDDTFVDTSVDTPADTLTTLDIHNNVSVSPPSIRPNRVKHTPSHLKDYVCNSSNTLAASFTSGISYPISSFHSFDYLSSNHKSFSLSITHDTEPKNYEEACKNENWKLAMQTELDALAHNGTWVMVELPPHVKPIGSRWVYKVKHRADGSVERYKARLVAKGYNQVEGLDFFDTFSPVAKLSTVRVLLAIASINHWHLHQLDVNNAFLHGDLNEDVYMTVPQGITCSKPNQVCKLQKSLYGLRQASRQWYEKLTSLLLQLGYTQSTADYSMFTFTHKNDFTVLLVYVDDIILAGTSLIEFDRIKNILDGKFKIKDLGTLKYFLGLEVAQSKEGITISQRKYCLDLLKDSGLLASKPATTPLDPSLKLHHDDSEPLEDITAYRRLIGRLIYLNNTRPDITLATQQLSQFLHKPTQIHHQAACRIVRYLKMSPGHGLFFPRSSNLQVLGYTDADWAGCIDTRRSTTGYCFFLGSSLVS